MNVAGPFESTPTDPDFLLPTFPNDLYKMLAFASGELAFLSVSSLGDVWGCAGGRRLQPRSPQFPESRARGDTPLL